MQLHQKVCACHIPMEGLCDRRGTMLKEPRADISLNRWSTPTQHSLVMEINGVQMPRASKGGSFSHGWTSAGHLACPCSSGYRRRGSPWVWSQWIVPHQSYICCYGEWVMGRNKPPQWSRRRAIQLSGERHRWKRFSTSPLWMRFSEQPWQCRRRRGWGQRER